MFHVFWCGYGIHLLADSLIHQAGFWGDTTAGIKLQTLEIVKIIQHLDDRNIQLESVIFAVWLEL